MKLSQPALLALNDAVSHIRVAEEILCRNAINLPSVGDERQFVYRALNCSQDALRSLTMIEGVSK